LIRRYQAGTEVLYYHRSTKGQRYAEILNDHLVQVLDLPNRGAKSKAAEDRGGYLLMNTNVPCVIAEPFFIDNNNDLKMAQENRENLVAAYFSAISAIANHI
jgi:N-acetylmuramoyl-L-alanine amidase